MSEEYIIRMAQEIAMHYSKAERFQRSWTYDFIMQRLMELVAVSAVAERNAMVVEAAKKGWSMKNEDSFEDAVREIAAIRARRNT
jgi:hypothetical protein